MKAFSRLEEKVENFSGLIKLINDTGYRTIPEVAKDRNAIAGHPLENWSIYWLGRDAVALYSLGKDKGLLVCAENTLDDDFYQNLFAFDDYLQSGSPWKFWQGRKEGRLTPEAEDYMYGRHAAAHISAVADARSRTEMLFEAVLGDIVLIP